MSGIGLASAQLMYQPAASAGGITQLTGDVTAGPGSGVVAATIANGVVTYAKMQAAGAASILVGRGAAGGTVLREITLGTNLSMTGDVLNAASGTNNPAGAAGNIQYYDGGAFGAEAAFTWDKANNRLGLGTDIPVEMLSLLGVTPYIRIEATADTQDAGIRFYDVTGQQAEILVGASGGSFPFDLNFRTAGEDIRFASAINGTSERMMIRASTGAIGIGQNVPTRRLHVKNTGAAEQLILEGTSGNGLGQIFQNQAASGKYNWLVGAQYNVNNGWEVTPSTATDGLTFTTPVILVTQTGRLGVNTSAPGATLDVRGDAIFNEDGDDKDFRIEGDTQANLLFVDASTDRVGIGTNAPAYRLHVKAEAGDHGYVTVESTNTGKGAFARMQSDSGACEYGVYGSAYAGTVAGVPLADSMALLGTASVPITTMFIGAQTAIPIYFVSNDIALLTLLAAGNVGIGYKTPANRLSVTNNNVASVAIDLRSDDSTLNNQDFSLARILGTFNSTAYASTQLDFQTATAENTWLTNLSIINGNVGVGVAAFGSSATKVLGIANGTEPGSSPADMVQLYSVDISAGNASLGLRTETAVQSAATVSDRYLNVRVNGATYKLLLAT